ncbi:hypothetical protein FH972_024577 [Carpinus fangiana]|uniref:Uncharacterized protein n=1 Tax=Carpinus fangiana TaxID=176857 RepID=A0A5N6KZ47_9ROSI|nr:hypothetical protein FH972_024577 [Carpinus fangiana]
MGATTGRRLLATGTFNPSVADAWLVAIQPPGSPECGCPPCLCETPRTRRTDDSGGLDAVPFAYALEWSLALSSALAAEYTIYGLQCLSMSPPDVVPSAHHPTTWSTATYPLPCCFVDPYCRSLPAASCLHPWLAFRPLLSSCSATLDATLPVPTESWSFQAQSDDSHVSGLWGFAGPVEDAFITFVDDTTYATKFALDSQGRLTLSQNTDFYANVDTSGDSQVVFFNSKAQVEASGWVFLTCTMANLSLHCCAEATDLSLNILYSCPSDWAEGGALVVASSSANGTSACTPLTLRAGPKPPKFGEVGAGVGL